MLIAAGTSAAVPSIPPSARRRAPQSSSRRKIKRCRAVAGNLGHFVQIVKNDVCIMKKNVSTGINWTSRVIGFPEISKKLEEVVWLRNLEDPHYSEFHSPCWPQPYYPGFFFHFIQSVL